MFVTQHIQFGQIKTQTHPSTQTAYVPFNEIVYKTKLQDLVFWHVEMLIPCFMTPYDVFE